MTGLNISSDTSVPFFCPWATSVTPPSRPPSPLLFTLFVLDYIVAEVENPIVLMSLTTKQLFISFFSTNWPLKNNVGHEAHHHSCQDRAVNGDEVFVEPVAEEARRAGAGRGCLSYWRRAFWAIREEVIGEGRWRQTHFGGWSKICWEERICMGDKWKKGESVRKETHQDKTGGEGVEHSVFLFK